jgi:hypothetical protein
MRGLRNFRNIEYLGKKSRFAREVKFQLVVGQVTSKVDEKTRTMKILGIICCMLKNNFKKNNLISVKLRKLTQLIQCFFRF